MASHGQFRPKGFRFLYITLCLTFAGQIGQLRRTLYLVFTVAVAVGAWWGLSAMTSPFLTVAHHDKSHDITLSSHRGRISQPLPKRYAAQVAAIPKARGVYYRDIDVIQCGGSKFSVTLNAVGGPGTMDVFRQEGYSVAQLQAFHQDPLAILTDAKTAQRCGWHVGMGVSPPNMRGHPMELHVRGIIDEKGAPGTAYAHYAYINRVGGITQPHQVTGIYVHAAEVGDTDALVAHIQALFAHDDPPVEAVPDTVNQSAWARFGNVQYLLAFVMIAVFACCALVLTSVMAHTTTQRRTQMALMQVLGFPRLVYWAALILEIVMILAIGAALGYGLGNVAIHWLQRTLGDTFQSIGIPAWTLTWLWPGLCVLLVAALIVPSVIMVKVRPTDCRDG